MSAKIAQPNRSLEQVRWFVLCLTMKVNKELKSQDKKSSAPCRYPWVIWSQRKSEKVNFLGPNQLDNLEGKYFIRSVIMLINVGIINWEII